ncbi:hypothetical protein XELAEV_18002778mg [Xenopus laevis]|uniref:Uncharacterized protein n=1 Tax=Xenopus laevis TaxID=8355 RepID=A0A974BNC7_XENLA|nr:hypothetical protein XELAEV_18002778mg [Xenopus laevis]
MIKRRRFEVGEIEKKSQVEKKTSEGKSIKKRAVEEGQLQKERQAKKKSSKLERIKTSQVAKDDRKITEENSKERNVEQNEGNSRRSRPEDLLEGKEKTLPLLYVFNRGIYCRYIITECEIAQCRYKHFC